MKFITTRKKTLFDGDQEELFTSPKNLRCPSCASFISFYPGDLKNCSKLPQEKIDLAIKQVKGSSIQYVGEDIFMKVNHLPLKYCVLSCPKCSAEHIAFFGLGEYQPGRFLLILAAIAEAI